MITFLEFYILQDPSAFSPKAVLIRLVTRINTFTFFKILMMKFINLFESPHGSDNSFSLYLGQNGKFQGLLLGSLYNNSLQSTVHKPIVRILPILLPKMSLQLCI